VFVFVFVFVRVIVAVAVAVRVRVRVRAPAHARATPGTHTPSPPTADYRHIRVSIETSRSNSAFASPATSGCTSPYSRRRSTTAEHSMADPLAIA